MTFFHYTSVPAAELIRRRGRILPVESNVGSVLPWESPTGPHAGPDVVWLLDDSDPFAFEHGLHTEKNGLDKRAARFEVDVPALRWLDWQPGLTMAVSWRATFITVGGGFEAAEHWYVWPAAIRSPRWVGIDILVDQQWQRLTAREGAT